MKFVRNTFLLSVGLLALTACKNREEPAAAATNPLLAYVPGETPFLVANLEPTPADVVDAYLERFRPGFELVQDMLDDLDIEIQPDGSHDMTHAALFAAVLNELDGKLNRAGIESLGLSLESHKAFYGLGAFPVLRVALRDADALRAAIGRIETEAGTSFPMLNANGTDYYRLAPDGGSMGMYMAILADHLAVSAFPVAMEGEFLPNLLAQQKPAGRFDANAELASLNQAKGFLGYGSGYFDFRKLAAEFMLPESRTNRGLNAAGASLNMNLDTTCTAEFGSLIDKAPRMVMGTTEMDANAIGVKMQIELESTLAGSLANLVSAVAPAAADNGAIVDLSLALQAGRVRAFALEKAMERSSNPFACAHLQAMNQAANQALEALNQPMPPFIGNLNGLRLRLQEVDFSNPQPQTSRGLLVLEVEKPQMLVGSAQMFIPGLENLDLEAGGEPVEVPQELMTVAVDGMHIFAAMSKRALGVSMGKDQADGLMAFLEAKEDNAGTFFSVDYDMSAQMQFQQAMGGLDEAHAHAAEVEDAEAREMLERLQKLEQTYREMLGRSRLEFRFVPDGFEIYNRVTFN